MKGEHFAPLNAMSEIGRLQHLHRCGEDCGPLSGHSTDEAVLWSLSRYDFHYVLMSAFVALLFL